MLEEVQNASFGPVVTPGATYHHVAIQTRNLDNALAWYLDFLGGEVTWLVTDFADLTKRRLPGIRRLAELRSGEMRLHLFDRGPCSAPSLEGAQFNHLCLSVADPTHLKAYQRRWHVVRDSGKHTFTVDEPPTEILVDESGIQSFYARDTDGLELEFTWVPLA